MEEIMLRSACIVLLIVLGLGSASGYQRTAQPNLNPEGQPQALKIGATHRFYVWHDKDGWHLRTTTARDRHRFHGEVVADDGSIRELRTFQRERNDWVKAAPNGEKVFFDLSTDEGIDGFDFRSDSQNLRFRLFMDGKERPELVFVGLTGSNPSTVPFALTNPEGKPKQLTPLPRPTPLSPLGRPDNMGPGSTHRFLVWRNKNGLWQLRTTTAGEQHNFSGEILAEGGRIFDLQTAETEKRDWVLLANTNPGRITFNLVTKGTIDGFQFRTDAKSLKFTLKIDGEVRVKQIYIGSTGTNPVAMPFTLEAQ
jgi:hypothetical protein